MQPTAPSYRQTRQRFLDQRLPFVKAVSSLFPNDDYATCSKDVLRTKDESTFLSMSAMLLIV